MVGLYRPRMFWLPSCASPTEKLCTHALSKFIWSVLEISFAHTESPNPSYMRAVTPRMLVRTPCNVVHKRNKPTAKTQSQRPRPMSIYICTDDSTLLVYETSHLAVSRPSYPLQDNYKTTTRQLQDYLQDNLQDNSFCMEKRDFARNQLSKYNIWNSFIIASMRLK